MGDVWKKERKKEKEKKELNSTSLFFGHRFPSPHWGIDFIFRRTDKKMVCLGMYAKIHSVAYSLSQYWWPGGPLYGPEGHDMARRAHDNFLRTGHRILSGHITQSSEPSRRLGSEVSRVSGSPRGHVAKSLDHFPFFQTFLVTFMLFLIFFGIAHVWKCLTFRFFRPISTKFNYQF